MNSSTKTLLHFLVLIAFLTLAAGCQDDDAQQGVPYNSFDLAGQNYDTFLGYLLFDEGPTFQDRYALVFQNGNLVHSNSNGLGTETSTTNAVVLFVNNGTAVFNNCADVAVTTGTFPLTDDSRALYGITQFNNTFASAGLQFGTPDENSASRLEVNNTGSGSVTINSITIDYVAEEAQVDLSYSITDGTQTLTGQYLGRIFLIKGL